MAGATLTTFGIFLPAFFVVAVNGPLVPRLRRSPMAGAFLRGVIVGSLALMAVVTFRLGRVAVVEVISLLLAVASGVVLMRLRLNSVCLILGGALIGCAFTSLGK